MKNRFAKEMENESDVRKSRSWLQTVVAPVLMVFYIAGCILGILTELGQGLTDYRSCDINDFRADALGMALSSIIIIIIDTIRRSGK